MESTFLSAFALPVILVTVAALSLGWLISTLAAWSGSADEEPHSEGDPRTTLRVRGWRREAGSPVRRGRVERRVG